MNVSTCSAVPVTTIEQIRNRVVAATHHAISDLDISLLGRELVLTGRSRTFYAKQLATHAALEAMHEFLPVQPLVLENDIRVD